MISSKIVKAIGFLAAVVGLGTTFVSNWVAEKKMEETVDERVNKLFTKRFGKEEVQENQETEEIYYIDQKTKEDS